MATDSTVETKVDQDSYKYDVAFSFLSQDEALATEINDLLQDRLKTFIYSERQREIAGTDGAETFTKIFAHESRTVVVLYRLDWGNTPWTRIEKTAIQNRSLEEGYDFALFIPLDEPPTVPKWLPRNRLWLGLKRYGPEVTAGVIESRVQEQGGEPHEETVIERAVRLERQFSFTKHRNEFLNSFEGVRAANQEFEYLVKELQHLVTEIEDSIRLNIKQDIQPLAVEKQIVILGFGQGLRLLWICPHSNELDTAKLVLEFWEGHPPFSGISLPCDFEECKLESINFKFDLTPSEQYIWHQTTSNNHFETKELASFILKQFMEKIQDTNIRT
jgi:hypothetical protein